MLSGNSRVAFKNSNKIAKLLKLTVDEAEAPITYYVLDKLSGKLGLPSPSVATFFQALREDGFKAVATHFNSLGVRTDASSSTMQATLKRTVSSAR
jgi:tRNA (guanine26-N2/guanine27-N2)-dimethyltransferase